MKKNCIPIITALLLSCSLLTLSSPAAAARQPVITIDGKPLAAPVLVENGRSFVPLRAIAESWGANVSFQPDSRAITVSAPQTTVTCTVGSRQAIVNHNPLTLQTAPFVRDGTTYVPVRFIAEAFGANLVWNGAIQTVIIRSPNKNYNLPAAELRKRLTADPMSHVSKAAGLPGEPLILYLQAEPAGQVITLTNLTDQDLTLSGWWLREYQRNGTFRFPEGLVLPAGQHLRISIGENRNTGDLWWQTNDIFRENAPNRIDLYRPSNSNVPVLVWEG